MKKFNTLDAAAIIIWLLPMAYLIYVYPSLPASVPVHFGMNGAPDRYGSKTEFLAAPFILMGVSVLVYLLMKYLPAIDPKKYVKYGEPTFQKIGLAIVVLMAALNIEIVLSAASGTFKAHRLLLPAMGLFFAFMGNVMHSIKPNYFAGLRTPWTLEDADTWRATHRLAGKLWFAGGIAVTILALLLPAKAGMIVFGCVTAVIVLIPVVYSYIYYKNHHPNKTAE
ncbi:MAG: SdpI family protein [Bacteroidetes bacterium]|nr:SdpI family protein [Bacteroidota bacterium]